MKRQNVFPPAQESVRNGLLASLSKSDWEMVSPSLELVQIRKRQVLHHPYMPMQYAFFVENGLVSVSAKVAPEQWMEAWLVGSEGMIGLPIVLGDTDPALRRVVQVGGHAFRIAASDLAKARDSSRSFEKLLLRYISVVLLQAAQWGACDANHSLKQRLARWLLFARLALDDDKLPITHKALANLLGVRRPSVTSCLGVLDQEQSIRIDRGLIRVSDRRKLETACCHCHGPITRAYDRLIGRAGRPKTRFSAEEPA